MASGKFNFNEMTSSNGTAPAPGTETMMSKVLNEKENYIGNLENEISEMRKEIEIQRD